MIFKILKFDKISIDSNIFELGMDSLSIIQLQSLLFKYNCHLNTQDFYDNPSIEELAQKIEGNCGKIDDKDVNDIIVPVTNFNLKKDYMFENIMLTGATGFLGVHILDYLITNTKVNVWCLVRGKDEPDSVKRLKSILSFYFANKYDNNLFNRIHVLCGDISENNLGLLNIQELSDTIDTVFHCAGLVKHYGKYEEFYNVNVKGTENIAKFCKKYDKKLNYISTLSVSGNHLTENDELNEKDIIFNEKSFYIGQKFEDNVYVRSKFEAEKLIYKGVKDGLNANVFRVGNLTWRSTDGKYQKNNVENAFYGRLKIIYKTKMIPKNLLDTEVEFTPVDKCAEAIVKISREFKNISNVYHIYNPNELKLEDIIKLFEKNEKIKLCTQEEFSMEIANRSGLVNMFANDINDKNKIDYSGGAKYSNAETNNYLQNLGFKWEKISDKYILNFIESMVE